MLAGRTGPSDMLAPTAETRRELRTATDDYVSSKGGVCDCRSFALAIGPVAGVGRQAVLSVERDDDLAVGAALLDVAQRLEGLVERERVVDVRAEVAGVVEGGQFAQLGAVGVHEQE